MALSTADLVSAYKVGARFVTVNSGGVVTETHQDYSSALKAGGVSGATVSSLSSLGALTGIANTIADRHDYGKKR